MTTFVGNFWGFAIGISCILLYFELSHHCLLRFWLLQLMQNVGKVAKKIHQKVAKKIYQAWIPGQAPRLGTPQKRNHWLEWEQFAPWVHGKDRVYGNWSLSCQKQAAVASRLEGAPLLALAVNQNKPRQWQESASWRCRASARSTLARSDGRQTLLGIHLESYISFKI